jgi:hypothetical protein
MLLNSHEALRKARHFTRLNEEVFASLLKEANAVSYGKILEQCLVYIVSAT